MVGVNSPGPLAARVGAAVRLKRQLDEFPVDTLGTVTEADRKADSYQLRIEGDEPAAFVEARRSDFDVVIEEMPRPFGIGAGFGYSSDVETIERRYGLTPDEYHRLLGKQAGECAICGRHAEELGRPLVVDHNHESGEVRGLLCNGCNVGIGCFGENAWIVAKAAEYLEARGWGPADSG